MPAKPRSIIAYVEDSGTAATCQVAAGLAFRNYPLLPLDDGLDPPSDYPAFEPLVVAPM